MVYLTFYKFAYKSLRRQTILCAHTLPIRADEHLAQFSGRAHRAQTSDRSAEPRTARLPPALPDAALPRRSSDVGGQPGECRAAGTPVDRGLPPQAHLLQHNAGEWQGTYTRLPNPQARPCRRLALCVATPAHVIF